MRLWPFSASGQTKHRPSVKHEKERDDADVPEKIGADCLRFVQGLVARHADHAAVNAFLVGIPLREAHTDIVVVTNIQLAYRHDRRNDPTNGRWVPYEEPSSSSFHELAAVSEASAPRPSLDLWFDGAQRLDEQEKRAWQDLGRRLRRWYPDAEVTLT